MDVVLLLILKLSRLVYGVYLDVGVFFPNRKLIITLGRKQKRKNESSDELSDAKQTPQRPLKDEDSQVSKSEFFPFKFICGVISTGLSPCLQKVILLLTQVTLSLLPISHRQNLTLSPTFPS